ncbi:hypothetical protein LRQ11_32080, partial [Pseudomonas sp. MAFF 311095]|nr:hypothetical protein [Pseudomonas petroselini]
SSDAGRWGWHGGWRLDPGTNPGGTASPLVTGPTVVDTAGNTVTRLSRTVRSLGTTLGSLPILGETLATW